MRQLSKKYLKIIVKTNELLNKYGKMTLRQIYYQFVPLGFNYQQIGNATKAGREYGLIDPSKIVDRSRPSYGLNVWESPQELLETAAHGYKLDYWKDQPHKVEVWSEKDTLSEILQEEAEKYRVPVRVTRGNLSIGNKVAWSNPNAIILYFGDFDPSGLGIDRDLKNNQFLAYHRFERIGLTLAQIQEHNLPSFKVKKSDNQAPAFIEKYGNRCWELDALPPDILRKLVREGIEKHLTFTLAQKQAVEREHISILKEYARASWEAV